MVVYSSAMELEDGNLGDRPRFIRFVREELKTIEKISPKNLAKLIKEKWNELHPDMKVSKNWVWHMVNHNL